MDALYLVKILLGVSGFVVLILVAYLLTEAIRILVQVRKMVDRVYTLTEARTWINVFKKITPFIFKGKKSSLDQ